MISITFILQDGSQRSVDAEDELNVMKLATANHIAGIEGACGGFCSCATCHVYVESHHVLPRPAADEQDMLECTAATRRRNSRLACQIKLSSAIDGLALRVPDRQ